MLTAVLYLVVCSPLSPGRLQLTVSPIAPLEALLPTRARLAQVDDARAPPEVESSSARNTKAGVGGLLLALGTVLLVGGTYAMAHASDDEDEKRARGESLGDSPGLSTSINQLVATVLLAGGGVMTVVGTRLLASGLATPPDR